MAESSNHLFYGDNLVILRERIPAESVDLVYLDPPFNSNRSYNVLFKSETGSEAAAQIQAFDDTWHWSQQAEQQFEELVGGAAPARVADAIMAMRHLLGTNDVLAYLVMMAPRLVELHRTLRPTGSLYLHCDPTASHYLKVLLDAIFGAENFRNEVIWWYRKWSKSTHQFLRNHDVLLFYSKSSDNKFNILRVPLAESTLRRFGGKRQDFADEAKTRKITTDEESEGGFRPDVWQINLLAAAAKERLGYPTQKPLALLKLVIEASSSPGDVVLDPFAGCGTTIDAAQHLGRHWTGIDITYLAIDLIRKRLRHTYGEEIENSYTVHGVPADMGGAAALFDENPFDFERWAVSLIDALPNEKQVGDKGIDGRIRFHADKDHIGQAIVSVKGGKTVNPSMVRDLVGTVQREKAELGILITMKAPGRGMIEEAEKSGTYQSPLTGQVYPKVQIITISALLSGERPKAPTAILPYMKATPHMPNQLTLDS